jgi:hypothetical protein
LRDGVGDGEVDQLAGGVLVGEVALGLERLAQLAVERLDRVGGVDQGLLDFEWLRAPELKPIISC